MNHHPMITRTIAPDGTSTISVDCACGTHLWDGPARTDINISCYAQPGVPFADAFGQAVTAAMRKEATLAEPVFFAHLLDDNTLAQTITGWTNPS